MPLNHSQGDFFCPDLFPVFFSSLISVPLLASYRIWFPPQAVGSTGPCAGSPGIGIQLMGCTNRTDPPQPNCKSCSQMPLGRPPRGYQEPAVEIVSAEEGQREISICLTPDGNRAGLMTFLGFLCPDRWLLGPPCRESGRGGEAVHLLQKQ